MIVGSVHSFMILNVGPPAAAPAVALPLELVVVGGRSDAVDEDAPAPVLPALSVVSLVPLSSPSPGIEVPVGECIVKSPRGRDVNEISQL